MGCTRCAPVLAIVAAIAACDQNGPAEPSLDRSLDPQFVAAPDSVARDERLLVCKDGPAGTYNFTVSGTNQVGGAFSLAAGACIRVSTIGGVAEVVTVTETGLPAGTQIQKIEVEQLSDGVTTTTTFTSTNSASGTVGGSGPRSGAVITFFNEDIPTGGGEGCTPGYWKQSQHFDSWPAPYTPSTLFSAVFEDAFPGLTLLQVLSQGGGGLNALGRHTVAALLNAASAGVDYDLSVTDVINGFNSVFPGGDYEGQKNIFEGFNEQACPLN